MTTALAPFLVTLLAASEPAVPAAPRPAAGPTVADETTVLQTPPPAGAEDQALWRRGHEVDVQLPVERSVSTRLQAEVNGSGWTERLEAAVRRGTLDRKKAAKLSSELLEEWNELASVLSAQWPVDPTRVCAYPLLDFDNVLTVKETGTRLSDARGRLLECVDAAARVLAKLRHHNGAYRAAFDAIDRATPSLADARAPRAAVSASAR